MFPLGIKVNSFCTDCTFEFKEKEFPPEYLSHSQIVNNNSRTPIWQFAGVISIALLITFMIARSQIKKSDEATYINSPVTGDVYHYKIDYKAYSTMKVISVNEDSIFYVHNKMETDMSTMLDELNVEENYDYDEVFLLFIKDLDSLEKADALIDIIRESDK